MFYVAAGFLVIGLIAALFGFTTIWGATIVFAKYVAGLFLILFVIFLVIGLVTKGSVVE
jgi:uncharacterized membrane protein YtjA (UPF0391 family)